VTKEPEPQTACDLLVEIRPTPTAGERDALLAAVAVYLAETDRGAAPAGDRPPRWALAGRVAAMRAREVVRGPGRAWSAWR
jgi:hypothetical protein